MSALDRLLSLFGPRKTELTSPAAFPIADDLSQDDRQIHEAEPAATPDFGLDPLSQLAIKHGSDKFGSHLYTPIYHDLFAKWRHRPVRLLEIGVGGYNVPDAGGGSLRMWAEYFPSGQIVGLDLQPKTFPLPERVTLIQGSQTDLAILDKIVAEHGPFDIIVDDGSHDVRHVLASFHHLYAGLSPEGIYIVEDTQTSFSPTSSGNKRGDGSIFEVAYRVGLAMHDLEGYRSAASDEAISAYGAMTRHVATYRNLVVFERGDNTYPSNAKLDFDHPAVDNVYAVIAAQESYVPNPRNVLSRIDMNIWGHRTDIAAELAMGAAAAHPEDKPLLAELARMMAWAKRPDETAQLRQMLADPRGDADHATVMAAEPQTVAASSAMD